MSDPLENHDHASFCFLLPKLWATNIKKEVSINDRVLKDLHFERTESKV
jgi:hypothetical protein